VKRVYLLLIVPDDVDPEEVVETMSADFYYGNRHEYEARYPNQNVMENIQMTIVKTITTTETI
jgi:hypothetical protein